MTEFQLYDYLEDHETVQKTITTTIKSKQVEKTINYKKYIIHLFGRCEDGKSVYVKLTDYFPYFYILIPIKCQQSPDSSTIEIINNINDNLKQCTYSRPLIHKHSIIQSKRADFFTNDKLFYFIKVEFESTFNLYKWKNYIENNPVTIGTTSYNLKLYESDLNPMLRCLHIRNVSGCSWVKINSDIIENSNKTSICDIEIHTRWDNISPIEKHINAPIRICSFDIECYSENGDFPKADRPGNKIIQIGYSYTYLGYSKPYRKYIGCLKKTDDFSDDVIVKCFTNEKDLLKDFAREITESDCDIITGYNIYFFDEKYIYDRSRLLGIDISNLSKLKDYSCKFVKGVKLSSATLGENSISIWNTPGKIHVDLMKDIQRTYNLPSYKLDHVASHFIKGNINSIKLDDSTDNTVNKIIIETNKIQDIYKDDWIHIEINKGFISDYIGNKYLIDKIDNSNNTIIINDPNNELKKYIKNNDCTLTWSQAKDDISAQDIFNSYTSSSYDRSIIAKYCIKDCTLVNSLLNKLEVISKNIEMANVCFVPLNYLFTRGQGVKIFSLCMKEFKSHGYLFPTIYENKTKCFQCNRNYKNTKTCPECNKETIQIENTEENNDYNGAIVLEPIASIEYEALAVKDYSSLYPSSIIQKNISHETIIKHDKYLNIDDLIYHTATYKENNKNVKCVFAKKDNKFGVLPSILLKLLNERKQVKKSMKNETDAFKYSILNAKQLAIKVTANSLYGQLGSVFSHIRKKELAASTTSTGREMLMFAKKYDEERLPYVLNTVKYFIDNNDNESLNKLFLQESITKDNVKSEVVTFVKTIMNDTTIQPIIKYGDTDSIFSCYRFKENSIKVSDEIANIKFNSMIEFSQKIVEPYFEPYDLEYYIEYCNIYKSRISNRKIPIISFEKINPENYKVFKFVKRYYEEGLMPLIWSLMELLEKNRDEHLEFKLLDWIHIKFTNCELDIRNVNIDRKQYLCNTLSHILFKFYKNNEYVQHTDNTIHYLTKYILEVFSNEIDYSYGKIYNHCKELLNNTIKDKWEYSIHNKKLKEIVIDFLKSIVLDYVKNVNYISYIISKIIKYKDLTIDILLEIIDFNSINVTNIKSYENEIIKFVENYNKYNGRKSIEMISETFLEHNLNIDFNKNKKKHITFVYDFLNNVLRNETMYDINTNNYNYYWFHPKWIYENENKMIHIDVYKDGDTITDKRTLNNTIKLGTLSGIMIKQLLEYPHDCEYEKTYYPFIILKKKKYVGNKYEFDENDYYQDVSGIVLKRRDNSPIVKEICGSIINYMLKNQNIDNIRNYTKTALQGMFQNKYNLKYFLQSRNLKSKESYKDWTKIAHMVLANRIMERDPGNVIQSGTRLEYAVIKQLNKNKNALQGDLIESKEYIEKNNLELDYLFYLNNQIMNPAIQFLELVDKNAKKIFTDIIEYYSKTVEERKMIEIKDCTKLIKSLIKPIVQMNNRTKNIKSILINTDKIFNNRNASYEEKLSDLYYIKRQIKILI